MNCAIVNSRRVFTVFKKQMWCEGNIRFHHNSPFVILVRDSVMPRGLHLTPIDVDLQLVAAKCHRLFSYS
jgi:hypothetical protein